jgi:ribonuclease BN (tRNA processing enzyme)
MAVEAGCLASELTFEEQKKIRWIFLSHGHYDHIRCIPSLAFNCSNGICSCPDVFSIPKTLEVIKTHLIDGIIYPAFDDSASYLGKPTLKLRTMETYRPEVIDGYSLTAVPVKHTIDTVGFEITSQDGKKLFYTGDTGPGLSHLWDHISPQLIIADTTFPNRLEDTARQSGHLCPVLLGNELRDFIAQKGYTPEVILVHLSPEFEPEISRELEQVAEELNVPLRIASEGEVVYL